MVCEEWNILCIISAVSVITVFIFIFYSRLPFRTVSYVCLFYFVVYLGYRGELFIWPSMGF